MISQTKIPCVLMRGGTSKGTYFLASDLPADEALRDDVLLSVMGSPDARQIEAARQAYSEWRQALVWVCDGLISGGMLREVDVAGVTPKAKPWELY